MEKYINNKRFPSCIPSNQSNDDPFAFIPGHRQKIARFITEVKQMQKPQKMLKRKAKSSPKRTKKVKIDDSTNDTSTSQSSINEMCEQSDVSTGRPTASLIATTDEIRTKVLNWGRKEKLSLVENQHFTILVEYDISDSTNVCAFIRCGCGKKYTINQKAYSWLISNWSRHYHTCTSNKKEQGKQDTLVHYFQPSTHVPVSFPEPYYPNQPISMNLSHSNSKQLAPSSTCTSLTSDFNSHDSPGPSTSFLLSDNSSENYSPTTSQDFWQAPPS
jgi:hypothetical protein